MIAHNFHPINVDSVMPFHSGEHVLATKGTGLVQTAPAHGSDDFLIGLKHKIQPVRCHSNSIVELFMIKSPFSDLLRR